MGVFRLDTFNPIPSLTLVNEAPFTKGRGLARPEGPLNMKHYTGRLLKNSSACHCERLLPSAASEARREAISDFKISMTWRLLRRLRLLAKTAFRTFSATC